LEIASWFPSPIAHEDLPEAAELHRELAPLLLRLGAVQGRHQPQIRGEATSGANAPDVTQYLHLVPSLAPLFRALFQRVPGFLQALGVDLSRERPYLGRSWVNVLQPGAAIERHHHANALVSAAYYVQVPEGDVLRFLDPRAPLRRDPQLTGLSPFTAPWVDYPVREGRLLLFPGWLEHGMPAAHGGEGLRVSVSFDVYSVSLSGMSPPPPPADAVAGLWQTLESQAAGLERELRRDG
jgi:uncharacterized protein (TIGR02466 family)